MSNNLSSDQFGQYAESITSMGAMPRDPKFDDLQPAKIDATENRFAPNQSQPLAKPGFF
jgi:hypothetical protein